MNKRTDEFRQARVRIVLTYFAIIACVIALFSFLVILEARSAERGHTATFEAPLLLTADDVRAEAHRRMPERAETGSEYEIEDGTLYYTVELDHDVDVKGDLMTGEIFIDTEAHRGFVETFTDDFAEMVGWIGLGVFLLAALGSAYVAHRTLRPIADNLARQRRFISGAAHELRNPLAAMHARVEAHLRQEVSGAVRDTLADLLTETKRLINVSEDLLSIERAQGRSRGRAAVDVETAVRATLERLGSVAEKKDITFTTSIARIPLTVHRADLETMLYNLVHNAIKFSRPSGSIAISWDGTVLTVADKGSGINAKDIPYVFERFYTTDLAGSGLGLAIVKEVAEQYGGTVNAESVSGEGSTFTISF